MIRSIVLHILMISLGSQAVADVPISQVLSHIDIATGKSKDVATAFPIQGVVSARSILSDGMVLAYVQPPGAAGVPVLAEATEATGLIPRNEVRLTGSFSPTVLGFDALRVKKASVALIATNKSFGASEPRSAAFFKDASSLAGRYVSLTNVQFVAGKVPGNGRAQVTADGITVNLLVTATLSKREIPNGPVNVFGVPVRLDGGWGLLAARFLPVSGKQAQVLASKHTCFTCHNPDVKAIGPAYRDVAARYKDDPEAVGKLISQMERGGTGKWGAIPMPPLGAKVPIEDRKALAEWIMGYKWDAILAE